MLEMLKTWYNRRFSDPQAMGLFAILLFGFISIYFFSDLIAPLLIAIVIAYLLEWPIRMLTEKLKFPRILAIILIFGGFISLALLIFFVLLPHLLTQTVSLLGDLPRMFNRLHDWVFTLPESYPELIDYQMVGSLFTTVREKILTFGESAVKLSISSLINMVTLGIYVFLVPLMVFFMIKDKKELINSLSRFLPRNRTRGNSRYLLNFYDIRFELSAITLCCCRHLGISSLCRSRNRDYSGCASGGFPIRRPFNLLVYYGSICNQPAIRRKPACATTVFRSRQPTSFDNYCCSIDFRRFMGILGRILRDPTSHISKSRY